jgi:predicted metal-dependent peptidase
MLVKYGDYKVIAKGGKPPKDNNGKPEDKSGWKPQPKKVAPKDTSKIKNKIEEIINRAGGKGTGGGGESSALRKFIDEQGNPQLDWRKTLARFISKAEDEVTLYKIPNRRFISSDLYIPGLRGKEEGFGTVVIAVDTSGSIQQAEWTAFLGECKKILKTMEPKEVFIIYCSDGMEPPSGDIDHLTDPYQSLDKSKMKTTYGNSGGFDPPFIWTQKNIIDKGGDLACFIYFTDGGATIDFRPKWEKQVIWAMTTSAKMPFGMHMNIPLKKILK